MAAGDLVVFYDVDSNMDIFDVSASFSHSALLASWFNGSLDESYLRHIRSAVTSDSRLAPPFTLESVTRRYQAVQAALQGGA
jgi:hypothetical protein